MDMSEGLVLGYDVINQTLITSWLLNMVFNVKRLIIYVYIITNLVNIFLIKFYSCFFVFV